MVVLACGCAGANKPASDPYARYFSVHSALQTSGLTQVGGVNRGQLAPQQTAQVPIELTSECITVVALGGEGVQDLQLTVNNEQGKAVAKEELAGPDASLRVCAEQPGKHELVVRMAAGAGTYLISTWAGGAAPPPQAQASTGTIVQEGGGTCDAPTTLVPGQTYVGDTSDGRAYEDGSCGNSNAREMVYRLDLPTRQRVTIEVRAQYDSVLYVRRGDCTDSDSEVACNDDAPGSGRRSRIDEVLEPGAYFVFVDGYGEESGAYRMTVRTSDAPQADNACQSAPVLAVGGPPVSGNLMGMLDSVAAKCGRNAPGPDATYRIELDRRQRVRIIETATAFPPVLHARTDCAAPSSEVLCKAQGFAASEAAVLGLAGPGPLWVFADGSKEDGGGDFKLSVEGANEHGEGVAGDTCGEAISLTEARGVIEGDTFRARADVAAKCGDRGGADVVYRLDVARPALLSARIRSDEGEHKLSLQRSCGAHDGQLACGRAVDHALEPGTYWVVVKAETASGFVRFRLGYRLQDQAGSLAACRSPEVLTLGHTATGSTANRPDQFSSSCGGDRDAQGSPDRVYRFDLRSDAMVTVRMRSLDFPGLISLRRSCDQDASEIKCERGIPGGLTTMSTALAAGTYYVVVDGIGENSEGNYTLEVQAPTPPRARPAR